MVWGEIYKYHGLLVLKEGIDCFREEGGSEEERDGDHIGVVEGVDGSKDNVLARSNI